MSTGSKEKRYRHPNIAMISDGLKHGIRGFSTLTIKQQILAAKKRKNGGVRDQKNKIIIKQSPVVYYKPSDSKRV